MIFTRVYMVAWCALVAVVAVFSPREAAAFVQEFAERLDETGVTL